MERYRFEVTIGFTVEADNEHDAMRAALDVESSLNDSSIMSSHGGGAEVIRSRPPLMRHFARISNKRAMPSEPVKRSVKDEIDRRHMLLDPLTFNWRVELRWQDYREDYREYAYTVTAPTSEIAIRMARTTCYHNTGHMGSGLTVQTATRESL